MWHIKCLDALSGISLKGWSEWNVSMKLKLLGDVIFFCRIMKFCFCL
jgi:hypothetical protein